MNLIIIVLNLNKHPSGVLIFLPINKSMSLGRTGGRLGRSAIYPKVLYVNDKKRH